MSTLNILKVLQLLPADKFINVQTEHINVPNGKVWQATSFKIYHLFKQRTLSTDVPSNEVLI